MCSNWNRINLNETQKKKHSQRPKVFDDQTIRRIRILARNYEWIRLQNPHNKTNKIRRNLVIRKHHNFQASVSSFLLVRVLKVSKNTDKKNESRSESMTGNQIIINLVTQATPNQK